MSRTMPHQQTHTANEIGRSKPLPYKRFFFCRKIGTKSLSPWIFFAQNGLQSNRKCDIIQSPITFAPLAQLDRAQASDAWLSQVRILFGVPKNYGESQMRFRFWLSPFFLRYSWSSVSSSSDDSSFLSGSLSFSSFFLDCSSFSSRDLRFFSSRIASSSS